MKEVKGSYHFNAGGGTEGREEHQVLDPPSKQRSLWGGLLHGKAKTATAV